MPVFSPLDANLTLRAAFDDQKRALAVTDVYPITEIQETVGNVQYIGYAVPGSLASEEKWQIVRITDSGSTIYKEFAEEGARNLVWDDRVSYFASPPIFFANSKSLLFDGVNDTANSSNNPNFNLSASVAFSMFGWVNFSSVPALERFLFGRQASATTYQGYGISKTTGNLLQVTIAGNITTPIGIRVNGSTVVTNNTWYHIGFTYDGTATAAGTKLYVNGVLETPTVINNTLALATSIGTTGVINLGARGGASNFLDGNIDEVVLYNKELTPAEVTQIYNMGDAIDFSDLSNYSNVVEWWRNGDGDMDVAPNIVGQKQNTNLLLVNGTTIVSSAP